jgi:hypothetical protein
MRMRTANNLYVCVLVICVLWSPARTSGQLKPPDDSSQGPLVLAVKAADPFDVETGIYSREYADLFVKDSVPIQFSRTQRNMDSKSRSFGVGGSSSYDMFIVGDVQNFSWVALVLADGSQVRYARISPGSGFADAVFENLATPGAFPRSRISWSPKGDWTVALRDGTELTVQGCNARSKPGQCALSEIKNAKGERLTVQRDKDGNILRVTSPHGHYVSVVNDSEGHITRAETDSHQWVEYRYDGKGCLIRARNWRGDKQTFAYDSQFNMTFVHEKGPRTSSSEAYDFTITNSYDGQNRLKRQKISTGEVYWAQYITDAKNHTRETVVGNPSGRTRYFFNQAGYVIREEFRAPNGAAWTLEQARDPNSNSTVRATLHCATGKTDLPLGQNSPLELNGESEIAYFTRACELIEKKRELQEKRASGNDP